MSLVKPAKFEGHHAPILSKLDPLLNVQAIRKAFTIFTANTYAAAFQTSASG
jgi:hypothetical protein